MVSLSDKGYARDCKHLFRNIIKASAKINVNFHTVLFFVKIIFKINQSKII